MPSSNSLPTLTHADAQAVDALLADAGLMQDAARHDARTRRVAELLQLMAQDTADAPPADLTQRTLARVEEYERQRETALRIQALAAPVAAFHWRELIAVAAVLLLGLSVMWPMLAASREEARRLACQSNLGLAGTAMAGYAADNHGVMPRVASMPQTSWASVGMGNAANTVAQRRVGSNPANLFLLTRQHYLTPDELACPDNTNAPQHLSPDVQDWPNAQAVSYSYQNQFTPEPLRLDRSPTLAVLADKNPLFAASDRDPHHVVFQANVQPDSATLFHQQRGQNILLASGATLWQRDPILSNGDNIWTAQGIGNYVGNEAPANADDSFLIP